MAIHILKTWIEYFDDVANGIKTFEIRKNDRNFQVGDILLLEEYCNKTEHYTGAWVKVLVTYILDKQPFVPEGYVCMAIRLIDAEG